MAMQLRFFFLYKCFDELHHLFYDIKNKFKELFWFASHKADLFLCEPMRASFVTLRMTSDLKEVLHLLMSSI